MSEVPLPLPELGNRLTELVAELAKRVESGDVQVNVQAGSARREGPARQRRRTAPTRGTGERVICGVPFLWIWVFARHGPKDGAGRHGPRGKRESRPARSERRPTLPDAEEE